MPETELCSVDMSRAVDLMNLKRTEHVRVVVVSLPAMEDWMGSEQLAMATSAILVGLEWGGRVWLKQRETGLC